jgi:ABC-2 type transport system ATP-binding protein
MSDYPIRTEALCKTYNTGFLKKGHPTNALQSLSIEVPSGSVFGFLGPNGAGKTTTIKALLGLLRPTSGKAWLMDIDSRKMKSREQVSYMPENPSVYENMTGTEFLKWSGRLAHMDDTQLEQRLPIVLEEVGMTEYTDQTMGTYSRGRKQRIEIAQALLSIPRLLILDEPLSGLDPIGRQSISQLLKTYSRKHGTTVFFSSHILADVEEICDWIAILDNGVLKKVGRLDELLPVRHVEISGQNIKQEGIMFIEKMGEFTQRSQNRFSVFLKADGNLGRVKKLFEKYGATDIQEKKHCESLEELFNKTVNA